MYVLDKWSCINGLRDPNQNVQVRADGLAVADPLYVNSTHILIKKTAIVSDAILLIHSDQKL